MKKLFLITFFFTLFITGCTSSDVVVPTATPNTPTSVSSTNTPVTKDLPESTATSHPEATTEPTPTIVAAAPEATPTIEIIPTLPPAQPVGMVIFKDNLNIADQLVFTMENSAKPEAGLVFQGWLFSDDTQFLDVGIIEVQTDGTINHIFNTPTSENLLNNYTSFIVTLEQNGGNQNPIGDIVYTGKLDEIKIATARQVFIRNDGQPTTPRNTGFAIGLLSQADVALQHIQNASNAAAIGAQAQMNTHLEHVINILSGTLGDFYGDYTGDGVSQNPGDGFGVLGYAEQIVVTSNTQETADEALILRNNVNNIVSKIQDIIASSDITTAKAELNNLKDLASDFEVNLNNLYSAAQKAFSIEVKLAE